MFCKTINNRFQNKLVSFFNLSSHIALSRSRMNKMVGSFSLHTFKAQQTEGMFELKNFSIERVLFSVESYIFYWIACLVCWYVEQSTTGRGREKAQLGGSANRKKDFNRSEAPFCIYSIANKMLISYALYCLFANLASIFRNNGVYGTMCHKCQHKNLLLFVSIGIPKERCPIIYYCFRLSLTFTRAQIEKEREVNI